jgi:hypothetical protein
VESRTYSVGEDLARRWDWKLGLQRGSRLFAMGNQVFVEGQLGQSGCGGFREQDTSERAERLESFECVTAVDETLSLYPHKNLVAGQVA